MEILIIIGVLVLVIFILWKMKIPRCGNMILITGGIKTGKTMLSVHMANRIVKKNRRKVFLYNYLVRPIRNVLFKLNEPKRPRPEIYSNIPLAVNYIPMTTELLDRRKNFIPMSVCYLCETSIVADSMSFKDADLNERLLFFSKLFAHQTKGGTLILDTQALSDNHYSFRRNVSTFFWIHHQVKIPFFCLVYLREMMYSEDGNVSNNFEEDVEESLKLCIVPKSVWKLYDRYCYSCFTDDLPVIKNVQRMNKGRIGRRPDLKARSIVTFKKFKHIKINTGGDDKNEQN